MSGIWKEYKSYFDNMTDSQLEQEAVNAAAWIKAFEAWKAAGKPRKGKLVSATTPAKIPTQPAT